jgi:hypothetical protein
MDPSYLPVFLALLVLHIVWDMFKFAFWTPRPAAATRALQQIAEALSQPLPPCPNCAQPKEKEKIEHTAIHVLSRHPSPVLPTQTKTCQSEQPPSSVSVPPLSLSPAPDS